MSVRTLVLSNFAFLLAGYFLGKKVQSCKDAVIIADIGMDAAKAIMEVKENYKEVQVG